MSSTPCFTPSPPTSPFIQIITLGNHNEFVADHFGFGERKGEEKKIPKVHFPQLKQAAGNYGQPFDPQKLSPSILSGALSRRDTVLHTC